MAEPYTYSKKEEIVNAITHGIGILFSIPALVFLCIQANKQASTVHLWTALLFGITMLILYVSSTLMHSLPEGKWKDRLEKADHGSISMFIAGTYTPFLLLVIKGTLGWILFGTIWGMALLGILFKLVFTKRFVFLSTLIYIGMGWFVVVAWKPLVNALPNAGLWLLIGGGICYTVGTIFFISRKIPFSHGIWHLMVLGGTILHFGAIQFYVLPL